MLDHICVVCGCSDLPGLTPPAEWLYELPTRHQEIRGDLLDTAPPVPSAAPPPAPRAFTRRRGLGAGLVELPPAPYRDPVTAIMKNPMVAEEARFCPGCFEPVGRGDGIRPGSAQGRCPRCGAAFSFVPRLRRGEVVGARYEVFGCLSHGGQGWIHLAKDHPNQGRWVVLKGIIHTEDPEAAMAALAEQRFLVEVNHPNIVRIVDFVWHAQAGTNYLVMEYLGGPTLRDVAYHHYHVHGTTLPVEQVIAYGLEILRAFAYLHGTGLLYCDLKPSNVLQVHDQVKLIDLGGVRRQGDMKSPMIQTAGFAAPELDVRGPTVASDIYTVGRTLGALAAQVDGTDEQAYATSPFDRAVAWATHPDPDQRPRTADELAEQLTAVLAAGW